MSASLFPSSPPAGGVIASQSDEFSVPLPSVIRFQNCRRCSFGGISSLVTGAIDSGGSIFVHSLSSSVHPALSQLQQHQKLSAPAMSVSASFSRLPPFFPAFKSEQSSGQHSRAESCLELEALAAVHQFAASVQNVAVSEMLPRTPDLIFVNVTTLEGQPFCLELTAKGWRVTSLRTDCMQGDFTRMELFTNYYQSLHLLMNAISPEYRNRFMERRKSDNVMDSLECEMRK